jgi:hypothetical protein
LLGVATQLSTVPIIYAISINGTCDDIATVFASEIPAEYSDGVKIITDLIDNELKGVLADDLSATIKAGVNALGSLRVELGFGGGLPHMTALFQEGIQHSVNKAVSGTQARINAIGDSANKQIAGFTGRVAAGVEGFETSTANTVNSVTSAVSEKLGSWGASTENYIGRLGISVAP